MSTTEAHARSEPAARTGLILNHTIELLLDAAHRARSPQAFFKESLALVGDAFQSPYAALELRLGPTLVEAVHEPGWTKRGFWKQTVEGLLTDTLADAAPRARIYQGRDKPRRLALLSTPIGGGNGQASGALALVTLCADDTEAQRLLSILSALCLLTSRLADGIASASLESRDKDPRTAVSMRKAAEHNSLADLARAITNRLRTRDGVEQVALGVVRQNRVRVVAISGVDEVAHRSAEVRRLEAAMEECLDARAIIVEQGDSDTLPEGCANGYRLHAAWRSGTHGAAVASIPLMARDECVAVLSVRRAPSSTFSADEIRRIQELVEPYAPTFEVVERATRTLGEHMLAALRTSGGELVSQGAWLKKAALAGVIASCAWFATCSVEHRVSVLATIAPVAMRQVAVPSDGVLRAVHVRPGDRVAAGNVLFEFDTSQLELERARLQSELALRGLEESRAVAADSPVEVRIARAHRGHVQAAIELVDRMIRDATVTAPAAGVVGGRAQHDRIGEVLARGTPLCDISSTGRWLLDLDIPERDVRFVRTGTTGRFSSFGRPEDEHRFQVLSVEPSAKHRDGATVFVAHASTDVQDDWVRPGMAGIARVDLGRHPVWWASTHRILDYLRFKLWI